MNFQRARSDEQKEHRMRQIKQATLKLYRNEPYQKISLSKIAEELNFTRANLYKYVRTKEEILLNILIDEAQLLLDDFSEKIDINKSIEIEEFALIWAEIFYDHKLFIELMSIMYSIIEKNVTIETLIEFKRQYSIRMIEMGTLIQKILPTLSYEMTNQFMRMQMFYAMGLYPATNDSPIQKEAIERSGIPL